MNSLAAVAELFVRAQGILSVKQLMFLYRFSLANECNRLVEKTGKCSFAMKEMQNPRLKITRRELSD